MSMKSAQILTVSDCEPKISIEKTTFTWVTIERDISPKARKSEQKSWNIGIAL